MRGKKGFVRILEAFIAIMIIAGAMAFLYINQIQGPNEEEAIRELERIILDEISKNSALRDDVLQGVTVNVNNTIKKFVPNDYNYDFKICKFDEICNLDGVVEKEIFSDEVTISSTLETYDPRVVRIFIWEKD